MFKMGDKVKATTKIQSDDRTNGVDDGSPVVKKGTEGLVLGKSEDMVRSDCQMKDPTTPSWLVRFRLGKYETYDYDCTADEIELIRGTKPKGPEDGSPGPKSLSNLFKF
jgi:hypothetical protein